MLNFRKFFTCFLAIFILFSSTVLATETDIMPINIEDDDTVTTTLTANTIYQDLYIYNTESYTLSDIVYGNVFASTTKFVTNPRNNGGLISGNLFIISNEIVIGSEVTYSNNKDSNGNYIVSSTNSKSVIKGNVYALSNSFELEAGSVIEGDLYVASTNVNIAQDAVINGNVFIVATNVSMNGQIAGSAYITSSKFDMGYLAYITRDLHLNSETATLSGVIYRNAYVSSDSLVSTSYFRVDQNLIVNYANTFSFSGEVKENASINARTLDFKNDDTEKCIINGDLNYSTETELSVPNGIVTGEIKSSKFVEMEDDENTFSNAMFNFLVILIYIFVVVLLSKLIAPKVLEKTFKLNLKNVLINFVIGLASLAVITFAFLLLLVTGAGVALAFFLVIAYLFLLGFALPYLFYNISNMINLKVHLYVKLLIVTSVYYIISLIPFVGSYFVFITLFVGVGKILLELFKKKK